MTVNAADGMPHRVLLTLRSGAVLRAERSEVRGSLLEPFSEQEKHRKFMSCLASAGIGPAAADALYVQIRCTGSAGEMAPLLAAIFD